MAQELSQWLAGVRLEMIESSLSEKNVFSIESISSLTLEDVLAIESSLPLLQQKRFQREFIDKYGPFHPSDVMEISPPLIQMDMPIPSTSPLGAHSLNPETGKEFVANRECNLDQDLDSTRLKHEIAFEEECLSFLIDIIAQEKSSTLYSDCQWNEGATNRLHLTRDAHTSRLQRLRKYYKESLEGRESSFHHSSDHLPPVWEKSSKRGRCDYRVRFNISDEKRNLVQQDEGDI
jgi:hypothetical protein